MALGRVVLPRRAIARQQRARGEKEGNARPRTGFCAKSLKNLVLDVFLAVDYDSDLKNRCSPCRFGEIAIHILSLNGGSTNLLNRRVLLLNVY